MRRHPRSTPTSIASPAKPERKTESPPEYVQLFGFSKSGMLDCMTELNEFDPGGVLSADQATEVVLQYRALQATGRRMSGPEAVAWYEEQRTVRDAAQAG